MITNNLNQMRVTSVKLGKTRARMPRLARVVLTTAAQSGRGKQNQNERELLSTLHRKPR